MNPFYVPLDNESERRKSEKLGDGICGPASVAALMHTSIKEVLGSWDGGYPGFGSVKSLKETLKKYGYFIRVRSGKKAHTFPTPETDEAIVRIQWLDENGDEYYWAEASLHTHFVLMRRIESVWWVFCNSGKWFEAFSLDAEHYLCNGFVTSYLEIKKEG